MVRREDGECTLLSYIGQLRPVGMCGMGQLTRGVFSRDEPFYHQLAPLMIRIISLTSEIRPRFYQLGQLDGEQKVRLT